MSLCVILFYKDIMLEELIKIDQQILLLFNRYHTVYWDQVMWVYTGKYIWIPLILSFVWVYFRKNWKDALWTILMMILVVTVCDQFASTICKPYFARFRPAQDPDGCVREAARFSWMVHPRARRPGCPKVITDRLRIRTPPGAASRQ